MRANGVRSQGNTNPGHSVCSLCGHLNHPVSGIRSTEKCHESSAKPIDERGLGLVAEEVGLNGKNVSS